MINYREETKAHDKTIELLQKLQAEKENLQFVLEGICSWLEDNQFELHTADCHSGDSEGWCTCDVKKQIALILKDIKELEAT